MFQIDEGLIEDIVSDPQTYYKGRDYYRKNRVVELLYHPKDHHFQGKVKGSYLYQVEASFDDKGKFLKASCTCPAYDSFWGYCKHIAAVLLTIKEKNDKGRFQRRLLHSQTQEILEYFRNLQQEDKTPVQLEVTYEVERNYLCSGGLASYLSLRIGTAGQLYVVKNLREFMEKINDNEEIYFGKKFTFDPTLHKFQERDEKIIDLIQEIYQQDTFTHSSYDGGISSRLFHGKQVLLSPKTLKRFFNIVKEEKHLPWGSVKGNILGRQHHTLGIYEDELPISFELDQSSETMVLEIKEKGVLVPLVPEGDYFLTKMGICQVHEEQKKKLKPFLSLLGKGRGAALRVSKEEEESFLSEVYPILEEIAPVKIGENLEKSLYKPPFQGEVYFDKKGHEIRARLQWIYGEITLNPFSAIPKKDEKQRILMRDYKKEKQIIDFFEENEFHVRNEEVYLEEEVKIFEMLQKGFQELQQVCDIYYSEDFKHLEIKKPSSIRGAIGLNLEEDLLEFYFDIEDIEEEELKDILKSLKEKKKYYRLREGSFLHLREESLQGIQALLQQLELTEEDIQGKVLKIPKFKGLYVEELLRDMELDFIKRKKLFKKFIEDVREFEEVEYETPKSLQGILRNYQQQGFRWLKALSGYGLGGILADDMGLGKTLQVLSYLLSQKEEKGKEIALIVAPTSLVYNWLAEIERFTPQLSAIAVTGSKSERVEIIKNLDYYDIVVTSYPLLRRDIELYKNYDFQYCIIDEAQHIKNPASLNAKSVKEIKAQHRFALTGTPIENGLVELWSIFDFVMPRYLFSQHKFRNHFEAPIIKDKDEEALRDLGKLIKPFILRRLKKDVLQELPEKIESKMVAELTAEQRKLYLAYLREIKGEIEEEIREKGLEKSQIKILAGLMRLRQICCHPSLFIENYEGDSGKMELLEEVMRASLEGGHRILLFSQFTSMLKIIEERLKLEGIDYYYLDGSTPIKERGEMVQIFNEGKGRVFLISLRAGGTGLNLTGADTVIHFDPWWNPAVEEQATDRVYRIGQKNKVQVMKFITKGTIEEKIFKLQEKKKEMIEAVIQPGETMLSKISPEELMELLRHY